MGWGAESMAPAHRHFAHDGFALVPGVLDGRTCDAIIAHMGGIPEGSAGTRCLLSHPWCVSLAGLVRSHHGLASLVPHEFVAVQCTAFEKSASRNWLVPIHQDLSIPVAARVRHADLRGWSEKEGVLFVQPPTEVLEQLVAVRVHLDACTQQDGPLRVVRGTHLRGRIDPETAVAIRSAGTEVDCCAARGDVLVMNPLLLHASSKSTGDSRRRVLHFLFGPGQLPHGLRWHRAL